MNTDQKPIKIAKRYGYKPIKGLDENRPYVLLAEKDNRQFVIKTSHIDDEVALLELFQQNDYLKQNDIVAPHLHEHSSQYLIQDYIPGRHLDILSNNFFQDLNLVISKLKNFQDYLNDNPEFKKFIKGIDDNLCQKPFNNSDWLTKRVLGWFSDENSKRSYRFNESDTEEALRLLKKCWAKRLFNLEHFLPLILELLMIKWEFLISAVIFAGRLMNMIRLIYGGGSCAKENHRISILIFGLI